MVKPMDERNSFDRLVSTLSHTERLDLLHKLQSDSELENQTLAVETTEDDNEADLMIRFRSESFFLRLWLRIKSFFSSANIETLYNELLVSNLALEIQKTYPDLLDYRHRLFCTTLYTKLSELKGVSDFFKPGITAYEENQGAFYVFLGSLVMPDLSQRIDKEVSPYNLGLDREITTELRASLIRKMEEILAEIPQSDKAKLYSSVCALEWLKHFCKLPFDKLLKRFTSFLPGTFTCPVDAAAGEFASFAKVLCSGSIIHAEVIEALYLYSRQNSTDNPDELPIPAASDKEDSASLYLKKSTEQIKLIKMFIQSVPFLKLTAVANNSSIWHTEKSIGGEDWYVRYKAHWRKLFDQKWELWIYDKRRKAAFDKIKAMLTCTDYPYIPNRPWRDVWDGIPFPLDHSIGFLYAFFQDLYPVYSKVLKLVLVEGEFTQRENRVEFTDTYNLLNHLSQSMIVFNDKLSVKGIYGGSFASIINESLRTIQGQARIDTLMNSINSEARLLISQFADASRSIQLITGGILHESKDPRYDTLSNIASILGNQNVQFRQRLHDTREGMINALEIIKELESLEVLSAR